MIDVDAFDNGARQLADALSILRCLHPVVRPLLSSLWTARNLEADRVQPRIFSKPPTHTAGGPDMGGLCEESDQDGIDAVWEFVVG